MAARVSNLRAARSVMSLSVKRAGAQTLLPLLQEKAARSAG